MAKRKSFTVEFKRSILEWIYEDEDNPKTSYAAEQHFCAQGHSVTKQTIHGWLLKHDEICLNSDRRLIDYLEEGIDLHYLPKWKIF